MKIFVYGFGPYKRWRDNITVEVLDRLRDREGLVKKIFDVKFDEDMFISGIRDIGPNVVIGLGQHPCARKIRIERRAVNRKRESREEEPRPIAREGPERLHVNLKILRGPNMRVSYDAGDYVCNFSMYVYIRYCVHRGIKFAFLHIPMNADADETAGCLERIIDGLLDFS